MSLSKNIISTWSLDQVEVNDVITQSFEVQLKPGETAYLHEQSLLQYFGQIQAVDVQVENTEQGPLLEWKIKWLVLDQESYAQVEHLVEVVKPDRSVEQLPVVSTQENFPKVVKLQFEKPWKEELEALRPKDAMSVSPVWLGFLVIIPLMWFYRHWSQRRAQVRKWIESQEITQLNDLFRKLESGVIELSDELEQEVLLKSQHILNQIYLPQELGSAWNHLEMEIQNKTGRVDSQLLNSVLDQSTMCSQLKSRQTDLKFGDFHREVLESLETLRTLNTLRYRPRSEEGCGVNQEDLMSIFSWVKSLEAKYV